MSRRPSRRRHAGRGFALAEALVALSVAAVTLALLTSATWGLRQASVRDDGLRQEATDWLTARRVMQSWAGSLTTQGQDGTEGRFEGQADLMRMVLVSPGQGIFAGTLRITAEDGRFRLIATREGGVSDTRRATAGQAESVALETTTPLRFAYLVNRTDTPGTTWAYAVDPAAGLPLAVALEAGSERVVIARVAASHSGACLSVRGEAGMDASECRVR